jgi:hypothetical protein
LEYIHAYGLLPLTNISYSKWKNERKTNKDIDDGAIVQIETGFVLPISIIEPFSLNNQQKSPRMIFMIFLVKKAKFLGYCQIQFDLRWTIVQESGCSEIS